MSSVEYHESKLSGRPGDVVRCVWSLRAPASDGAPEPIISDGCVEIVFNLRDAFERFADGGSHIQPKAMVVGPTELPAFVRPTGAVDIIGIRLEPGAARCLLRLPLSELQDRFVALDDVVSRGVLRELLERLAEQSRWSCRHAQIAQALEHVVMRAPESRTTRLVELVRRHHADALGVRRLAALSGRSVRSVERVFREEVGLTPKTLMRIERIQRVLTLARAKSQMSWSAIAASCGFHDQPHFVREFRALVGCSPSAFGRANDSLTATFLDGEAHEPDES